MVSGLIPDSSIKASSFQDGGEPWRARLGHGSGWIPSSGSSSEYLEVDLGEPNVITYIEIEGDSHYEHWLDWFFLDYKMNSDEHWKNYQLRGRSEVSILRRLKVSSFLKAIYFLNPLGLSDWKAVCVVGCMRKPAYQTLCLSVRFYLLTLFSKQGISCTLSSNLSFALCNVNIFMA